jgi:hypothetical protein
VDASAGLGEWRAHQAAQSLDDPSAWGRVARTELRGAKLEQCDQLGRRLERVGDRPAAAEWERGESAAVGFGDQRRAPRGLCAIECRKPRQRR